MTKESDKDFLNHLVRSGFTNDQAAYIFLAVKHCLDETSTKSAFKELFGTFGVEKLTEALNSRLVEHRRTDA